MTLEQLRNDLILKQKKGLPFIASSVLIWILMAIVTSLSLNQTLENILVFSCSCPLLPLAWLIGKQLKVDIFSNQNPLGKLGFLFTINQVLYLLIVMWVFNAVPDKMLMVYAMVFGAHLLLYSWLYKSPSYQLFAILIPVLALILGNLFSANILALVMVGLEALFTFLLAKEVKAAAVA